MWKLLTILGCVLVTVFVVHTALRIEQVNEKTGSFLPRPPGYENQSWTVPEWSLVMDYVDHQIAERRADAYMATSPDEPPPTLEELRGEPYNEVESRLIEKNRQMHAAHSELHWWVTNFGSWQWTLAPLAFVWSVGNFLVVRKNLVRILSSSCALLAFGAIFLMIFRGY